MNFPIGQKEGGPHFLCRVINWPPLPCLWLLWNRTVTFNHFLPNTGKATKALWDLYSAFCVIMRLCGPSLCDSPAPALGGEVRAQNVPWEQDSRVQKERSEAEEDRKAVPSPEEGT